MTQLQVTNQTTSVMAFTPEQRALIKRTIAKDASDDELSLFLTQCTRTALDPFSRQIYFMKAKNGKVTIMTSVDGLRLIAERSDKYEGQTQPMWCGADAKWVDVWLNKEVPAACKVGVFKKGFREPLYAVAIFNEYAQRQKYDDKDGKYRAGDLTDMWYSKPALMIAKVAESLALRKAFPNDMSGIYTGEEMGVEAKDVEATVVDTKPNHEAPRGPSPIKPNGASPASQNNKSPDQAPSERQKLAGHIIEVGTWAGQKLSDFSDFELKMYATEIDGMITMEGRARTEIEQTFFSMIKKYLTSV